jgi:hypothetical protein
LGGYGPKLTICNSRRRQHDDCRSHTSAHQGALKLLSHTPILPNGVSVFPGGSTRTPVLRPSLPRRRPPSPAVFRPPRPRPGLGLRLLFLLLRARGFPRFSLNRGPPSCSSSRALRSLFEWGFLLPTFVSRLERSSAASRGPPSCPARAPARSLLLLPPALPGPLLHLQPSRLGLELNRFQRFHRARSGVRRFLRRSILPRPGFFPRPSSSRPSAFRLGSALVILLITLAPAMLQASP